MKRTITLVALLLVTTGCGTISRIHKLASDFDRQDAINSNDIAVKSGGDAAIEQCSAVKLDVIARAPDPAKITGSLSALAAKRAYRRLLAEVNQGCAEAYIDSRWALLKMSILGQSGMF